MPTYPVAIGDTATAAANTEVVLTVAAASYLRHVLKAVEAYYSGGTPANGVLTIEETSGQVVRSFPMGAQTSFVKEFPGDGLILDRNTALVVRLSAAGAGIIGRINITRAAG